MIVVLATVAVFAIILLMARGANTKDYALLFGGLEGSTSGDIITALDQQGVVYEVRGNAIYVESGQRDALRLTLAGQGLPASGSQGYELLDSMTGFGTTSQMFDAAYWRAKEGELARTIVASPRIRSARVHISTSSGRPFQREQIPTAAVTVQSANGAVSTAQVKALQYLVAAAVTGLSPENVAVIDSDGGLLSVEDGASASLGADERTKALRERAERLLAARVGPGNAVVEVTVETVMETESISERTVDPDSRVAISTDIQESAGKSQDSRGGDVTVASNLPDGEAAGGGGSSNDENTETRALTNYEVSETQRDILRSAGAVKRLTVAVLINDVQTIEADGTVTKTPRTPEELADLESLVASAVGLDEARGDQITLRSMSFEPISEVGTEALADGIGAAPLNIMQLIQVGVLAVVALILGLFVVRPILSPASAVTALPPPDSMNGDFDSFGSTGPDMMSGFPDTMAIEGPSGMGMGMGDMSMAMGDMDFDGNGGVGDDPVSRLRSMIADRETETIQILQDWMEEPEQKAET